MPPPPYHCDGQAMASDTTSLSLSEFTSRQTMIDLPEHGLDRRLLPTQGVEPELARVEIELRAHQAVGPPRIDREAPFQQTHRPGGIRAPHEDDATAGMGLQVQLPGLREGPTGRGRIDPLRATRPHGGHEAIRLLPDLSRRREREPGPDLRLPQAVVALDHRPEARLPRRGEHRHDSQAKAQPHDTPDRVGM